MKKLILIPALVAAPAVAGCGGGDTKSAAEAKPKVDLAEVERAVRNDVRGDIEVQTLEPASVTFKCIELTDYSGAKCNATTIDDQGWDDKSFPVDVTYGADGEFMFNVDASVL